MEEAKVRGNEFQWQPSLSQIGCWVFAAMMFFSAWMKAGAPERASHAIAWMGLDFDSRVIIVDLWSVVEALVAGSLLFLAVRRTTLVVAAVTAATLLVLHVVGNAAGYGDCGCFGALNVPDSVTVSGLVVGLLASLALIRGGQPSTTRFGWRLAATMILAGAISLPILMRSKPRGQPAALLLEWSHLRHGQNGLFLIGSRNCKHCEDELHQIAIERSGALSDVQIVFVIRESAPEPVSDRRRFPWLKYLVIPDDLWWRLLRDSPPSFVRLTPGSPLVIEKNWR